MHNPIDVLAGGAFRLDLTPLTLFAEAPRPVRLLLCHDLTLNRFAIGAGESVSNERAEARQPRQMALSRGLLAGKPLDAKTGTRPEGELRAAL